MHDRTMTICFAILMAGAMLFLSCSKKGGEGAACEKPADCRYGFRCEAKRCIGGAESACGYLLRCMPKLSMEDKETLFGQSFQQVYKMLQKRPQQPACEAQLNLIAQMGRLVVLNRRCGPRVME